MEPIVSSSSAAAAPSAGPVLDRTPRPTPRGERTAAGAPVRLRLDLQRRAHDNLQRHLLRAAARFGVLVVADLTSFGLMRGLFRAVRDDQVFGGWLAAQMAAITPRGILNGWQYSAALFASLVVLGCYGAGDQRRDGRRLFVACALATALPLWMTIWTRGLDIVLVQYSLTTALVWAGLVGERLTVDRLVDWVRPPERSAARTLFVGTAEECARVAASPAFRDRRDFISVGFVDLRIPPALESRGHIVEIARMLHESGAETVVACGHLNDVQLEEVARAALAAGCQLLALPRGVDLPGVEPTIVWRRGQPLVALTAPTLRGWQLLLKRAIDLLGASVGLIALSPLLLIVAALVRLESPGPILFQQERVGRGGRRFRILKFRTMLRGAESQRDALLGRSVYPDARLFKVPDDPRVTRIGRWLRRLSLDELPQLWNVVRGEMALVGPRPPLPSEVALYEAHHYDRFEVKPGMTGPWQVSGRNRIVDFEQVVRLETAYIRHWTLWSDVRILLATLPAVVRMRGAH